MKKKIFIVIAAMLVFGLTMVAFSYGTSNDLSATASSCCCCSGDSCPLKNKDASGKEAASCCDDCDCCKGDGACPMMAKHADGKAMKMDAASCPMMKKDANSTAVKTDNAKECPMMKKDADGNPVKMDAATMSGMHMEHHMKMDGKGCSCCHHSKEKEKSAAPAI